MVARFDLVPGEIIHNKIWGRARFDDLVACVRSANGERARTCRASCDQPRRRVFHHETCRVESVLSRVPLIYPPPPSLPRGTYSSLGLLRHARRRRGMGPAVACHA